MSNTVRWLTTAEAAARLGVSTSTIINYVESGELPAITTPGGHRRIDELDIEALLARRSRSAPNGSIVLAVANQKGGVGKTTTSVAVAAALADQGSRVLLVDLDPQANATMAAGFEMRAHYDSIYGAMQEYITGEAQAAAHYVINLGGKLDLLPSHIDLARMELELFHAMSREYVLRGMLDPLRSHYDWIVIDSPPSLGMLTINALTAADQVLVPQVPDLLSAQGLEELMRTIGMVRRQPNRNLEVAGVVLTKVRAHVDHHRQMRGQIAAFCQRQRIPFLSAVKDEDRERPDKVEIMDTIAAANAAGEGTPLTRYDRARDGAGAAYRRLTQLLAASTSKAEVIGA
jgi:chromosome partitioning protein